MKTILLTWATWYIGSHQAVALLEKWYKVIILDNLSNSNKSSLEAIKKITSNLPHLKKEGIEGWLKFYETDLRDKEKLEIVFKENKIDSVIHFAWAKAVWESCTLPFYYYENNIIWSLNLFELMDKYLVKNIIFSSSATVYKPDEKAPFTENTNTWNTTNPYWTTKFIIENILRDLSNHKKFNVINLRYFNPVWAHKSWLIGEDPNDIPNNLLPFIMKVVSWELKELKVFWDDYETKDWTWERDYIHVLDLIDGHIKALEYIEKNMGYPQGAHLHVGVPPVGTLSWIYQEINLWTWKSTSVLDMLNTTEKITWKKLKFSIVERRAWDIAISYCLPDKAKDLLNWEAKYSIEEAIEDSYNFIKNKNNKNG